MSIPVGKIVLGTAVASGATTLGVGLYARNNANNNAPVTSDDEFDRLRTDARGAGVSVADLDQIRVYADEVRDSQGGLANMTLATGAVTLLAGVTALAKRRSPIAPPMAALATVGAGISALSSYVALGNAKLGKQRAEHERVAQQQVETATQESQAAKHPAADTARDGAAILDSALRVEAKTPHDPSPSGFDVSEEGHLASIAERNLAPLDAGARYAAVVGGLRDINDEIGFWGPDSMVSFAEAAGTQQRPDGTVDIEQSMAAIDTNANQRLSSYEVQAFEHRGADVERADIAAVMSHLEVDAGSASGRVPTPGRDAGSAVSDD